jgi:hypothetical protein
MNYNNLSLRVLERYMYHGLPSHKNICSVIAGAKLHVLVGVVGPDEICKFVCIVLLYQYLTPSSQWSRPRWQARLASPLCHSSFII